MDKSDKSRGKYSTRSRFSCDGGDGIGEQKFVSVLAARGYSTTRCSTDFRHDEANLLIVHLGPLRRHVKLTLILNFCLSDIIINYSNNTKVELMTGDDRAARSVAVGPDCRGE